ncbi:hypothetical protein TG4357_01202 [Thalassovita gelatinovora]|uniref:Glycosyltransferase RgtA/B/C/D-like domain-containing protein n=1 Tax=Thalassovita gelatinovora TaxID=53501 RepID=A0A0P1F8I6_THAGE|nr:hypothetical protein [Thalassovita gelatinovora]QIZ80360.1 hypothetical protein HFZ77_07670 [Thalassovita gelatinovora]CUH64307.1 hypothetical protein TG4357_01202 [Thalassovita gelatinovora]SEQ93549.1 hypothetical protein SAMN04488043_11151 [Thalassovita gelatinovora]
MLRSGLLWFLAYILMLWPLLAFHGPIVFPDTVPYLKGAATGLQMALGIETTLVEASMMPVAANPDATTGEIAEDPSGDGSVSSARSPWFGGFLLIGVVLADGAGPVLIQAALVLGVIGLTCRNVLGRSDFGPVIAAGLALLTPLALYTDYLMPDLAAGVAILALANLMLFDDRMGRGQWAFWAVMLTGTLLFHVSHVLVAAVLLVLSALVAWRCFGRLPRRGIATVLAAIAICVAGQAGFSAMVKNHYGAAPMRPPFLTARLVADGPGFEYLTENCATEAFAICAYLDRMPGDELRAGRGTWYSNVLLWSDDPQQGVYETASPEMRARLSGEQMRFTLAVLRADPVAVIGHGLSNAVRQFFRWRVDEIGDLYPGGFIAAPLIDPAPLLSIGPGLAFEPARLSPVYQVSTGLALLACALLLVLIARYPRDAQGGLGLMIVILLGLVLNAGVTGTLSGVDDRYQTRVVWLLGLVVVLAVVQLIRRARA